MVSLPLLVVALQVLAVLAIYPADADGGAWSGEADEGAAAAASAGDPDKRKGGAADQVIVAGKGKEPASQLQRIRIRHGRSGSDGPRGNAAMALAEGAAKAPEICLALPGSPLWVQKKKLWRSLRRPRGGSEGSLVKDNEASWLGKGAADRDIEAGTSNNREEHADLHGETNVMNVIALDNSLVQRESLTTAERESTLADVEAEEQEERRNASKFSYFAAGISGAGIISIYSGYLGNQTGHLHSVHLKICTFFMLATFVSAASMVLLTLLYPGIQVSIQIFKSLKYATLVCLSLSALYVSYLFLKLLAVIAFLPTIIILLIAFIMVSNQNRPSHSSHQVGSSIPQSSFHLL